MSYLGKYVLIMAGDINVLSRKIHTDYSRGC